MSVDDMVHVASVIAILASIAGGVLVVISALVAGWRRRKTVEIRSADRMPPRRHE
ncbi:hypothetical protein N8K70_05180 [Microbacterium betulae]|uniref:Uncharacterized protein n=1 Tax=Microbacterium betulae TaxID=2981139 RepID=A0AA97FJ97_9MICO|nr:hypothetical protein [Microbacterium sp. AB]WOF24071.1 hypothetical protein N8K70_05180 [Microbacterium sp. AB]